MDDQQGRLVSLDYIAGLITGEGCFCLAVQRIAARKGQLRITPIFDIFMSDRETIHIVAESLKSYGLPVYLQDREKAARNHMGIHASGMLRVKRYCETFIPLMTGQKQAAAELVFEFINSRLAVERDGKKRPYTYEELHIVEKLRSVNGNVRGKKTPLEPSEAIRRTPVSTR